MELTKQVMESASAAEAARSTGLRRETLGAGFITLLVISAASPLSVVAGGFPLGIMVGNGAGTPGLVVTALALLLCFAAGYTAMAVHVTSAGGFYAMIARGLGGSASGMAAMVAVLGYMTIQFALYGLLGAVVSDSLQSQFAVDMPWYACSFAAMASVGWFGYRQIDFSAKVLAGFVVAEYLVVLVLDGLILSQLGVNGVNFKSFSPQTLSSGNPFVGLLFCFAAFIGFEATTIYSEEAKDPSRTIPIATYAALLLVGGFYSFSLWCLVLGAGGDKVVETIAALGDPTRFLYSLSDKFAGPQLTLLLRGLFIVSIYAGLIAFHNSAARYLYSMGRDGLLPAFLGVTHPLHRSPHKASLTQSVLCAAVVLGFSAFKADPVMTLFSWLSNLATICVLVLMIGTSLSVVLFFRQQPHEHGISRTVILPIVSGLGLCAVLVLAVANFHVLTGASRNISYGILGLVTAAALVGWWTARQLRRTAPARFKRLGQDRQ